MDTPIILEFSPNLREEDQNLFLRPAKDIREKSKGDCLQSLRLDNMVPGTDLFLDSALLLMKNDLKDK
jgi:hypothetical protein